MSETPTHEPHHHETKLEVMKHITAQVKAALDQGGMGEFTVSTKVVEPGQYNANVIGQPKLHLALIVHSQAEDAELDPEKYKAFITKTLEGFAPLKPYIDFIVPEPEKTHYKHLGDEVKSLIAKAKTAGIEISDVFAQYFDERVKVAALKEKSTDYIYDVDGFAVSSSVNDNFITAHFHIPAGINAGEVQKDLEARKAEFLSTFARMAAKNITSDEAERTKIIEQIKTFDVKITTQSHDTWHTVNIELRSPDVIKAIAKPGGLEALNADEQKALKDGNPLHRLNNGDGTPGNPAQLKKSLARAIFYTGEKAEKPIPLFAKIAGPLDVKAGIEKSLKHLKQAKPELTAEADKLLADPIFQQHGWGATKNQDGTPKKEEIRINKLGKTDEDQHYVAGQFGVELSIPADKLKTVVKEMAAPGSFKPVTPVVAAATPSATPPAPADVKKAEEIITAAVKKEEKTPVAVTADAKDLVNPNQPLGLGGMGNIQPDGRVAIPVAKSTEAGALKGPGSEQRALMEALQATIAANTGQAR